MRKKIAKAWVKTHHRVGGYRFYTAHIRVRLYFLGFIPYTYVLHVIQRVYNYMDTQQSVWELSDKSKYKYWFNKKELAEDVLLDLVDQVMDGFNHEQKSRVLKREVRNDESSHY